MHPLKRKITKEVERHVNNNIRITKRRLSNIHPGFAAHCFKRAEKENVSFIAVIHWELYGRPMCPICGKPAKFRGSLQQGFTSHCSSKCAGKDENVKNKRIITNQAIYGTNSPSQVKSIRKKQRKTMLKRYGVEFGGQHPEFNKRARLTLIKNHGVDAPLKSKELLAKARATSTLRYGVDNVMKNRAYFEKQQLAGFKVRTIKIQGKTFNVRGFETHVIEWLVNSVGIKATDILTSADEGVPRIEYYDKSTKKTRTYHPDMVVRKGGKEYIVEIKSTYTAGLMKNKAGHISGRFGNVKSKAAACEKAGWAFKLILVSKNKNKKECALISNITSKTKREVRKEYKSKLENFIQSDL